MQYRECQHENFVVLFRLTKCYFSLKQTLVFSLLTFFSDAASTSLKQKKALKYREVVLELEQVKMVFFIFPWILSSLPPFINEKELCVNLTFSKNRSYRKLTFLEAWHKFVNNILHCSIMTSREKKWRFKLAILIQNISL